MKSGWSNVKLRGQMIIEFYDFAIHESSWNKKSNETRIKWFRYKIREISLFQNQQKFKPNLDKNEEQNDFLSKIHLLNLF